MNKILLITFLLIPSFLLTASRPHRIRMILNVVDSKDRAVNISNTYIGEKVFNLLIVGDDNLVFLNDIGFKYVKSITININNDTAKKLQLVSIGTITGRILVKRVKFFNIVPSTSPSSIMESSRFENQNSDFFSITTYFN